jgi:hypothetical protein
MRRRLFRSIALSAAASIACTSKAPVSPAADSITLREDSIRAAGDTAFQARLTHYRHASRVIDSLTRLARNDPLLAGDSLYRIYRLATRPQGVSVAEVNAQFCTEASLADRYGWAAAQRAIKELRDTVFRDHGTTDGLAFFMRRAPDHGLIDSANCPPRSYVIPEEIDGIRLYEEPQPPRLAR